MRYLILSAIGILLSNCSTPQIQQDAKQNSLSIRYKGEDIVKKEGEILYSDTLSFAHINIYQYVYKVKKNYIVYEYVKATNGYKFTKGIKRSVGIIFHTNNYRLEYRKANLYFFKLKLQNQKHKQLYLILENINLSVFKMLYGISKKKYDLIQKRLQDDIYFLDKQNINRNDLPMSKQSIKQYIQTQWNPKMIILDNLVSKSTGRPTL